jgi:hypothetical protein
MFIEFAPEARLPASEVPRARGTGGMTVMQDLFVVIRRYGPLTHEACPSKSSGIGRLTGRS